MKTYQVIEKFNPDKDYKIPIRPQYAKCLASMSKGEISNAKESTIDVDFTIPAQNYTEFHRVLNLIPHGFKVDTWNNGWSSAKICKCS